MRLLKVKLKNFASYANLEFDFSNQGLALIYGATGSGKSTLQDSSAWILFNTTGKDGNADDIRSWNNTDEATEGVLELEAMDGSFLTVTRVRGKPSQNDLYWDEQGVQHRGKDITETQKLLELRLGVSKDLYIAGAYYNEFSPTGGFFTAKAQDRRELFEKLADLSLAVNIANSASQFRKDLKKNLAKITKDLDHTLGKIEQIQFTLKSLERESQLWESGYEKSLETIRKKNESFEKDKQDKINQLLKEKAKFEETNSQRIKHLEATIAELKKTIVDAKDVCGECGQPNRHTNELKIELVRHEQSLRSLKTFNPSYDKDIKHLEDSVNPYKEKLEVKQTNPIVAQIYKQEKEHDKAQEMLFHLMEDQDKTEETLSYYDRLYDLSFKLRGELLKRSIKQVEDSTNRYLEAYFDSELRVSFTMEDSDKLDIQLYKNGYNCVYRQLSKGQRCLLKLCFSVSVMAAAANRAGIHFNTILFDEALDGLDSNLKTKAFNLFTEISKSHETVLVVEHNPELINLFDRRYHVSMINDESSIEER